MSHCSADRLLSNVWLADQNRTVLAQLDQRISEIRNSNTLARQNSEAHHVA